MAAPTWSWSPPGPWTNLHTPGFHKQCPAATPQNTHVVLLMRQEPTPFMQQLLRQVSVWVADNDASFFVRIEQE